MLLATVALALMSGCSTPVPRQPPGVPPSPASVTRDEPGGDADNPEVAALERLLAQPWGERNDKRAAVLVGLPDSQNWRRVTFWLVDTFVGFRYGDDHHAVAAMFLRDAPSAGSDSDACMADFEQWAKGQSSMFRLEVTDGQTDHQTWRNHPVTVRRREGSFLWGLSTKHYAAAYASYVFWEGTCATLAYAFPMKENPELAMRVRDRFASEAFPRLFARGSQKP